MADQPFVLLGINTDPDPDSVRQRNRQREINWRSWWDGGVNGPVATTWKVLGLPYVVLLDQQGVVRSHQTNPMELRRLIRQLLAAPASSEATKSPNSLDKKE
jgi:hypothetical protein